jgi:hypothetical protein
MKFGLKGGLAYKEVELAIAAEVTGKGNAWDVMDDRTRELLKDPAAITRGLKRAIALSKEQIVIPTNKGGFVADWCEDLGYADFYRVAFHLFGLNAYSTHFLFMTLVLTSLLVFLTCFIRDDLPMATLTLSTTALFLLSASPMFSESVPSLAANRVLSVLGLIPLLHLVHAALCRRPFGLAELGAIALQALTLAFVASTRGTTTWCFVALIAILIAVALFRSRPLTWNSLTIKGLSAAWRSPDSHLRRLAVTGVFAFGVIAVFGWARNAQIDERYRREDNMPHHLFWHSAFLGLTVSPDWSKYKPYPDIPDRGDGVGFLIFEHIMKERGEPAATPSGFYRARLYEKVIRGEYLSFLAKHPMYALKLFFYDKPRLLFAVLVERIGAIPLGAGLIGLVSVSLVSVLLAFSTRTVVSAYAEVGAGVVMLWLSSLLPPFWAYPEPQVVADPLLGTWFMLLAVLSSVGAMALYAISNARTVSAAAEKPAPVDVAAS